MAGLTVIPKYPVEWLKFMRAPATYVEAARAPDQRDAYEPWAAFVIGLSLTVAFAAYEAHRSQGALDKETEQTFLLLAAALNFAIVHGVGRIFGGFSVLDGADAGDLDFRGLGMAARRRREFAFAVL